MKLDIFLKNIFCNYFSNEINQCISKVQNSCCVEGFKAFKHVFIDFAVQDSRIKEILIKTFTIVFLVQKNQFVFVFV